VIAGREFGHDATVRLMHCNLGMETVREQPGGGIIDRDTRLIAGGFDAEHTHSFAFYPGAP